MTPLFGISCGAVGADQLNPTIKERHFTTFNPWVYQSMYRPLPTFTGRWSIGLENRDTIRSQAYFRSTSPPEESP